MVTKGIFGKLAAEKFGLLMLGSEDFKPDPKQTLPD